MTTVESSRALTLSTTVVEVILNDVSTVIIESLNNVECDVMFDV